MALPTISDSDEVAASYFNEVKDRLDGVDGAAEHTGDTIQEIESRVTTTEGNVTTLDSKNTDLRGVSVQDAAHGATGDGTTDDRAAIASADTAAVAASRPVYFPPGTYAVASNITLASNVVFADGAKLKPAAGVTITFDGTIRAPLAQIFDASTGSVAPRRGGRVPIQWFGVVGDGSTDDSTALQAAIDAAAANSLQVFIPSNQNSYAFATTLAVPGGVTILGEGRNGSRLLYTGTGSGITHNGSNGRVHFERFTIDLNGAGAVAIDAARFINSTFRSLRFRWMGSGNDGTGIEANVTAAAWTPYYNVLDDCSFEALNVGISIDSTGSNFANRWRLIAPTFWTGVKGIDIQWVQGIDIIAPYFDELTSFGITLGSNVDRVTIVAPRQETNVGGSLFSIDNAANRVQIFGVQAHAGALGTTAIGTRGLLVGNWDNGIQWSGSTATDLKKLVRTDDGALKQDATTFQDLMGVAQMTTAQRDAKTPANGDLIYNTTLGKFQGYEGGAWANLI